MVAQRLAVCQLPLLASDSAGLIITIEDIGFIDSMNARLQAEAIYSPAQMIRTSDAATLSRELVRVRSITLELFDAYEAAGALDVPQGHEFNPPLWELGHIGWFQQWWVGRNQQRHLGAACDPDHQRLPCPHLQAAHDGDDWYNSSIVPHAQRWVLPLLSAQAARDYLQATLSQTLHILSTAGQSDDALYFYRLVLLHEAMHIEAAVYMAQALELPFQLPASIAIHSVAFRAEDTLARGSFSLKDRVWRLGSAASGFSFDNELMGQVVNLNGFEIDAQPICWAQYLPFIEATGRALPRYLRRASKGYEYLRFGQWQALDIQASAVHLSWHDAQAYCLWVDRRLPTEAEWEYAAATQHGMCWGEVWEWTASDFLPYEGFSAHPYRDYSEPWFGSRKVLRGACAATLPIMRHTKYRNYFTPDRTDIYAGFRTCSK
jgi:gamma-glutamyl hercynylcysteine S-oxide synthase